MSEGLKDKSPTPTIPQTSPTYSSPLPTSLPQPPQTAPPSIKIITPSSSYNDVSAVDPSNRNPFAKVFSPAELGYWQLHIYNAFKALWSLLLALYKYITAVITSDATCLLRTVRCISLISINFNYLYSWQFAQESSSLKVLKSNL